MGTTEQLHSGTNGSAPKVSRSPRTTVGRWIPITVLLPNRNGTDPAASESAEGNGHWDGLVGAWLEVRGSTVVSRRVLVKSKGRPVVQYRFRAGSDLAATAAAGKLVAKGYNRGDGAATFAAMEHLWQAGFGDDPWLTMPEPLAYLPGPRVLLQTTAAGSSLYRYLDDIPAGMDAVRLTGRWLSKLHTTVSPASPVIDQEREAERLERFCDALAEKCPEAAGRFRAIAAGITAATASPDRAPVVPTHGDFQPKNVHVTRRRVTVIDFDRFALAEPVRDLGHFVAQSMTMSYVRTGSFRSIEPWNDAFLEEYIGAGPDGALTGLPAAVVWSMLEILYYKLVVRPVRDASFLGDWLDECDRCLEPVAP